MASRTPTSHSSRRILATRPLEPDTFSVFGQVIQNPATHNDRPSGLSGIEANQGTAQKWMDVTSMQNHYELARSGKPARCVINMFVCKPRTLRNEKVVGSDGRKQGKPPLFDVDILERHPFTPQTFIPLGLDFEDRRTCYLVIVAPTLPLTSASSPYSGENAKGAGPPDLDNIQAFIARGDQAVTYGAGTWHAPMVVLGDRPVEFVVVQYANGVATEDCQEVELNVDGGDDGLSVACDVFRPVKAKL